MLTVQLFWDSSHRDRVESSLALSLTHLLLGFDGDELLGFWGVRGEALRFLQALLLSWNKERSRFHVIVIGRIVSGIVVLRLSAERGFYILHLGRLADAFIQSDLQ